MNQNEFQLSHMIKKLHTRLLVMYTASSIALDSAVRCLWHADRRAANSIIDGDAEINALEREIDDISLSILVRTHAVASDLRLVIGALRIINDLERIADEAVIIAERATLANAEECAVICTLNTFLLGFAQQCLSRSFDIFRDRDVKAAIRLCEISDDIAQAEIAVVQEVIRRLTLQDKALDPGIAIQSIMVCRSLTRICRRSVNLAEHTFFICTGENIKHADIKEIAALHAEQMG